MITKEQVAHSSQQLSKLEALSSVPAVIIEANRLERVYVRELSEGLMANDVKTFQEFLERYDLVIKELYKKIGEQR